MSDKQYDAKIDTSSMNRNQLGVSASSSREVSMLELAAMRINGHVDYLNTIAQRLENAADAIFGSQPQAPITGAHGEASKPFSKMDGLSQAIESLERVLSRIEYVQERLSAL